MREKEEIEKEIAWFTDLREALENGNIEDAKEAADAALKLLWKEKEGKVENSC